MVPSQLALQKAKLTQPEDMGVNCVDPILSKLILSDEDHPEQLDGLKQGVRQSRLQGTKLLLVPVYSHFHWSLLVAQREGPQQPTYWRRYDSLQRA